MKPFNCLEVKNDAFGMRFATLSGVLHRNSMKFVTPHPDYTIGGSMVVL
jgi:hypothetical protein